jgi:aerobic carbon-monoxide dehydrogenase medium subunit
MIPASFDYVAPSSLDEAVALLAAHDGEAKVLSGGQSLIPMLKLRLAAPSVLVDINHIPGLAYIHERDGALRIGALTREAELEHSPIIRDRYPILADTARVVADPLVRNSATICGNIAHGDPSNDHPATMIALGASIVVRGKSGTRTIPAHEFFVGLFTTALTADEIVTEIAIPIPPARSGGAYLKLERKVGDYATAGVAVQLSLDDNNRIARAGVGLTNVGPTPIRATRAESFLVGRAADDPDLRGAPPLAADESDPVADRRGSPEYKRDIVRVLTGRALRIAIERASARRA